MFLQDLFRALRNRRRRLAEERNDRHGVELTRRLREVLDTSSPVSANSNPPRKPVENDETDGRRGDHNWTA
jgi:hypothetical protein